ncbi:hypothetical protein BaRGS_00005160 [Batillaria attramentaria]|uniref:Uncharacterized protein n=1 Tax=Batillaria attramentaria TaxID=370345 RepID=A0ABD0LVV3_9CAEN
MRDGCVFATGSCSRPEPAARATERQTHAGCNNHCRYLASTAATTVSTDIITSASSANIGRPLAIFLIKSLRMSESLPASLNLAHQQTHHCPLAVLCTTTPGIGPRNPAWLQPHGRGKTAKILLIPNSLRQTKDKRRRRPGKVLKRPNNNRIPLDTKARRAASLSTDVPAPRAVLSVWACRCGICLWLMECKEQYFITGSVPFVLRHPHDGRNLIEITFFGGACV